MTNDRRARRRTIDLFLHSYMVIVLELSLVDVAKLVRDYEIRHGI